MVCRSSLYVKNPKFSWFQLVSLLVNLSLFLRFGRALIGVNHGVRPINFSSFVCVYSSTCAPCMQMQTLFVNLWFNFCTEKRTFLYNLEFLCVRERAEKKCVDELWADVCTVIKETNKQTRLWASSTTMKKNFCFLVEKMWFMIWNQFHRRWFAIISSCSTSRPKHFSSFLIISCTYRDRLQFLPRIIFFFFFHMTSKQMHTDSML